MLGAKTLARGVKPGDTYLYFTDGSIYKIRRNGRHWLVLEPETENEEIVRCTLIKRGRV